MLLSHYTHETLYSDEKPTWSQLAAYYPLKSTVYALRQDGTSDVCVCVCVPTCHLLYSGPSHPTSDSEPKRHYSLIGCHHSILAIGLVKLLYYYA